MTTITTYTTVGHRPQGRSYLESREAYKGQHYLEHLEISMGCLIVAFGAGIRVIYASASTSRSIYIEADGCLNTIMATDT